MPISGAVVTQGSRRAFFLAGILSPSVSDWTKRFGRDDWFIVALLVTLDNGTLGIGLEVGPSHAKEGGRGLVSTI